MINRIRIRPLFENLCIRIRSHAFLHDFRGKEKDKSFLKLGSGSDLFFVKNRIRIRPKDLDPT